MWKYKAVYQTLKEYMMNIYSRLLPNEALPDLRIRPMGRTRLSKYFPESDNGSDGMIVINSRYLPENPTNNELIYFVMLIAHDLCQCVAMRKNEGAKPHGKEVKKLLKQIGLVYSSSKVPLSFTKDESEKPDGLLYMILQDDGLEDDLKNVKPPEIAPATKKAKIPQMKMNFEGVTINERAGRTEELYGEFYTCPHCKDEDVQQGSHYCPNCGCKIDWVKLDIKQQQVEQEEQEQQRELANTNK